MIISARHKCPICGREWMMPVNTDAPDWQERQKSMREGKEFQTTFCEGCKVRA